MADLREIAERGEEGLALPGLLFIHRVMGRLVHRGMEIEDWNMVGISFPMVLKRGYPQG